jgi:hypothetical protein
MSKFSKGPWDPTPGQIPPESIWSDDGKRICRLSNRYDDGAEDHETIMANARLIADAPRLLEQIRWMVEAYTQWHTNDDPVSREDFSMSLRAARQWLRDHD